MEEAGMEKLAQQQYRMLFRQGLRTMLADWEPSLLEALKKIHGRKITITRSYCVQITDISAI